MLAHLLRVQCSRLHHLTAGWFTSKRRLCNARPRCGHLRNKFTLSPACVRLISLNLIACFVSHEHGLVAQQHLFLQTSRHGPVLGKFLTQYMMHCARTSPPGVCSALTPSFNVRHCLPRRCAPASRRLLQVNCWFRGWSPTSVIYTHLFLHQLFNTSLLSICAAICMHADSSHVSAANRAGAQLGGGGGRREARSGG